MLDCGIDDWCLVWKISLWKSFVQFLKINTHSKFILFLWYNNHVSQPFWVSYLLNWPYVKYSICLLLTILFHFLKYEAPFFLTIGILESIPSLCTIMSDGILIISRWDQEKWVVLALRKPMSLLVSVGLSPMPRHTFLSTKSTNRMICLSFYAINLVTSRSFRI